MLSDAEPAQYLLRAPSPPLTQAPNLAITSASFQKFKDTLERQLACRTPLLDDVLTAIESRVQSLHEDLAVIRDSEDSSRYVYIVNIERRIKLSCSAPLSELISHYREDAGQLCFAISEALQLSLKTVEDDSGKSTTRAEVVCSSVLHRAVYTARQLYRPCC